MTPQHLLRRPEEDHESIVALPPAPVLRVRVRTATRELLIAQPGRRAAAISALWIAATGCEDGLGEYDPKSALQHYRAVEPDQRVELRIAIGRAIRNEARPESRDLMITMLELFEELEAYAVAPRPVRRRPAG